ncbi:hypothetical protein [Haloparvum sedimenti]|uniref:hypothetical protein n=1 Tax=Haloparvum sedimenti TaxID=1678448 RepID=UPI00071E8BBD|nr:hypothetical protein [Haloparvum sedimenti]
MRVTLSGEVLARYPRFSLYNSPYPAHDRGHAVDLYPAGDGGTSPVAGVVRETRTVGCPDRSYAAERDHLIVIDVDPEWAAAAGVEGDLLARVLHVDPTVEPGDRVSVGDRLGPMVRSGFFGQWVDRHVHLGFRPADENPYRASGSLPVDLGVDVATAAWDGTGRVVETGPTHAVLDAPTHPAPGDRFAALASDEGVPLDGGLRHYAGGGALGTVAGDTASTRERDVELSLLDERVGVADGRHVRWKPVAISANGEPAAGLSLFASRERLGVKLVLPEAPLTVGDEVRVRVAPTDDPVRFGVGR